MGFLVEKMCKLGNFLIRYQKFNQYNIWSTILKKARYCIKTKIYILLRKQVALYPKLPDEYISFCGGSVLNEWWILTAGHCCDKVSGFNVVAGGVSLQTSEDEIEQKRTVSKNGIFIHESYNDKESNNDICLILVSIHKSNVFDSQFLFNLTLPVI